MGTRHIVAVVCDGKTKVAQYGQWNGYPTGVGAKICDFIHNEMDLEDFKWAVRECNFLSNQEIDRKCNAAGDSWPVRYPELSRDTSAGILSMIGHGKARDLCNSIDFVADSLFCEYAYVIDLDNETLEVYRGFNTKRLPKRERFASMTPPRKSCSGEQYYPVRLWAKFPFKYATEENMEKLEQSDTDE